jgi:hypothetical protein
MKNAILLGIIFLFVCWSLYGLYRTEGFQDSPSSGVNLAEETKCSIISGTYNSLRDRYDEAVASNNQAQIDKLIISMDSMKSTLDLMGCSV